MDNKIKKLLFDMLTSVNNIEAYLGNKKKFEFYDTNLMLQDAVE
jgi:uncharacterized protein with HEPN domain